jgi:hypothetical protein
VRGVVRRVLAFLCGLVAAFLIGALVASPPMDLGPTIMIVFGAMVASCGGYMLSGAPSNRDEPRRIYARLSSSGEMRPSITRMRSITTTPGQATRGAHAVTIWLHALIIISMLVFVLMFFV